MPIRTYRATASVEPEWWIWNYPGPPPANLGEGTIWQVMGDDSDNSEARGAPDTNFLPDAIHLSEFTTDTAIPVGSRIAGIRVRHRTKVPGSSGSTARVRTRFFPAIIQWSFHEANRDINAPAAAYTTYAEPWWTEARPGQEYHRPGGLTLNSIIWNITLNVRNLVAGNWVEYVGISEVFVDLDFNQRPEANIQGPAGVVGNTSAPAITWNYSDPENDPQAGFEVRIYREPSGGWPVDPNQFPDAEFLVVGSGNIASSATSWTPPNLDNNESYRAYLRVRQTWNGVEGNFWSTQGSSGGANLWQRTDFSLDLDAPAAPTLVITPEPDDARVELELDDPGTTEPAAEWYTVEFRDSATDSWVIIRGAEVLEAINPVTLYDYEAPFNRVREYRARASINVDDLTITSEWTQVQATLTMPYGSTWVTDVKDPSNINFAVHKNPDRVRTWRGVEVVHQPANMDLAIIEADETTPQDTISFFSTNEQEHDILKKIFRSTQILLYRDDRREYFYFRWVGDRTRSQIGNRRIDADLFSGTQVLTSRPF